MGILRTLSRWFGWDRKLAGREGRPLRARYDSAQTSDDNRRHWANADGLSASAANSPGVRTTLRNRARYERANNGYCDGLVTTLADALVGKGARVKPAGTPEAVKQARALFAAWARKVALWRKLHTAAQAKKESGEAFLVLTTDLELDDPVKLQVREVECDQFATPGWSEGVTRPGHVDGIEFGPSGQPAYYHLLKYHPGDTLALAPQEHERLPARFVIHWFRRSRPGQWRGVPEITPSLPLFAQLRRLTLATLTAAETAASFAAVLETQAPADGETESPEPFETLEIERGMMTTLPANAKLSQFQAEHPSTAYADFKHEILKEIGRPVSAPYNVTAGDSSNYNFSSSRMDHLFLRASQQVERDQCENEVLNRVWFAWLEEARKVEGYLPAGLELGAEPRWQWGGFEAIEPLAEARADSERMLNSTGTLAQIAARYGMDAEELLEQRAAELELMRKLGIPVPGEVPEAEDGAEEGEEGMGAIRLRASALAGDFRLCGASEPVEFTAAAGEGKLPRFSMVAYTGVGMRLMSFSSVPVVIDLQGLSFSTSQNRPILKDHDPGQIVGHTDSIQITEGGRRLKVSGVISGTGPHVEEIKALSANGFPWQASVGVSAQRMEYVERDTKVTVNGRVFSGPVYVARQTKLGEVSFVAMGADDNTSASITATGVPTMTFEQWLAAKKIDAASLSEAVLAVLKAQHAAETAATPPPPAAPVNAAAGAQAQSQAQQTVSTRTIDEVLEANRAERERQGAIAELVAGALQNAGNDLDATREVELIGRQAVAERWTAERLELHLFRRGRPTVPQHFYSPSRPAMTADVLEAALCQTLRLPNVEREFRPNTLEAAHRAFKGGITLLGMLDIAARANGWHGHNVKSDLPGALRAVFSPRLQAAGDLSVLSVSGILSNTANKALKVAFLAVDSTWREISAVRNVSDFKTVTSYTLTGDNTYEKLAPGGEIKHGTLGETSYTNRADTYAKMLGIDRRDWINDDLSAFSGATTRLGRGAALKLNDVFWTEFLNNTSFFTSGRGNFDDGSDTLMNLTGINNAYKLFTLQTDPDGKPLGLMPAIMLVPVALWADAFTLTQSSNLNLATSTSASTGTRSPWEGMFRLLKAPYMSNTTYTGASALKWYLLANPQDMATIEVAFLNGVEMPTVETAELDFNRLGVSMRGYHDFGATKQEYRAGVAMKGES